MNVLYPRHRIDISATEIAKGLLFCTRSLSASEQRELFEPVLKHPELFFATLSVRSAFDLLLSALKLPEGSDVLMSAMTIPDMGRLVSAHGLFPVPVDVDPLTLVPSVESLRTAYNPKAKILVLAQLFGARVDLQPYRDFCDEHQMLLVDDSAQRFCGRETLDDTVADVALFSFGTIKTSTCLGGALARVKSNSLREKMRQLHEQWPVQKQSAYANKLGLYGALLLPRQPRLYRGFELGCTLADRDLDDVVMAMTKGFPSNDLSALLTQLRRQPCSALVEMLAYRLAAFQNDRVIRRAHAGELALQGFGPDVSVVGHKQSSRTHWLFAVSVNNPESLVLPLRKKGFDCARGTTSIAALPPPIDRPSMRASKAESLMKTILFLPMYPEIPLRDRAQLTGLLNSLVSKRVHCS